MKKLICIILTASMLFALAACGQAKLQEPEIKEWTHQGTFEDSNGNQLLINLAVFEEDPNWKNPVMSFVGEYQCDRAYATVECFGYDEAWITIERDSGAGELTRWIVVGQLDTDTLTINYSGASKANLVYDEEGGVKTEESVYDDGTGTIAFHEDGTSAWHEDLVRGDASHEHTHRCYIGDGVHRTDLVEVNIRYGNTVHIKTDRSNPGTHEYSGLLHCCADIHSSGC